MATRASEASTPSPAGRLFAIDVAAASTPEPTPSTPVPSWPLTLAAVGDIMLGRSVSNNFAGEEPAGPFVHVRDLLTGADIAIGNLECALTEGGSPEPKSYVFRAPPVPATRSLLEAGFDVLSLANNHALDYGDVGLADSLAALRDAGLAGVGAGHNADEAHRAVIIERNGVRVAFLAFAEVPDEAGYSMRAWTAGAAKPGIAWAEDEQVARSVSAAARQAQVVVVMFHFGNEGHSSSSARQRQIARLAVDAGADLVVGSHPHLLQEVEEYGGGLIAYSLGNFVFDGFDGSANESAVLLVSFAETGVSGWRFAPVVIGWDGLPRPLP